MSGALGTHPGKTGKVSAEWNQADGLHSEYLAARAANGGSDDFLNKISDKGLKDTCRDFGIKINEAFVD